MDEQLNEHTHAIYIYIYISTNQHLAVVVAAAAALVLAVVVLQTETDSFHAISVLPLKLTKIYHGCSSNVITSWRKGKMIYCKYCHISRILHAR